MKIASSVVAYFADLYTVLRAVNRLVYDVDPLYIVYGWISKVFSIIKDVGPFVFVVAGFGYIIETPQPSWTVVLVGIAVFVTYLTWEYVSESWSEERRRVFDALLSNRLKSSCVEHVSTLDLGRLVDPAFIQLSHMVETRGMSSVRLLWDAQKDFLGGIFALIISLVALLTLDWVLGLIAVCIAMPSVVKRWMTAQKRRALDESEILIHRQCSEAYNAIASPKMTVLVRLLALTKPFVKRHAELTEILVANVRLIARFEKLWDVSIGIITVAGVLVFGLYFSSELVAGHYRIMEIAMIIGSLRMVAITLGNFGWSVGQIEQQRKDYAYFKTFSQTGSVVDESVCRPVKLTQTPDLVVENLAFSYPNQVMWAIDRLSMTIRAGDAVAFVGPNGCGKTTLLQLLSRVHVASEGSICAQGNPLEVVSQDSWLCHVTMAVQGAVLPGMEIVYAITGCTLKEVDRERLEKALKFSGADKVVSKLPLGLETWIGAEWPNGKGFSTGEHQRLVLAAVFYRALDPNVFVVLFDEPTANCDAETKARFYQAITQAPEFAEKTVIVSLHDPLFLHFFDRVLQFDSGKLVNDLRGPEEIETYRHGIGLALAQDL